jgi:hypothetical protein
MPITAAYYFSNIIIFAQDLGLHGGGGLFTFLEGNTARYCVPSVFVLFIKKKI